MYVHPYTVHHLLQDHGLRLLIRCRVGRRGAGARCVKHSKPNRLYLYSCVCKVHSESKETKEQRSRSPGEEEEKEAERRPRLSMVGHLLFQTIFRRYIPLLVLPDMGLVHICIRRTRFPTIKGSGDSSDGRSGALVHIMDGATYFRAGMGRRRERERVGVVVAEVTQGTDQ